MAAITLEKLVKRFGAQTVLQQLSCTSRMARSTPCSAPALRKTTLLRCIAGFHEPDGGRLLFDRTT